MAEHKSSKGSKGSNGSNGSSDLRKYGDPMADFQELPSPSSSPKPKQQTMSEQLRFMLAPTKEELELEEATAMNKEKPGKLKRQTSRSRSPLRFMQPRKEVVPEYDDELGRQQLLVERPVKLVDVPKVTVEQRVTKEDLELPEDQEQDKPVNAKDIEKLKGDNSIMKRMIAVLLEHEEILHKKVDDLIVAVERNEAVAKKTDKNVRVMFDVAEAADAKAEEIKAELKGVASLAQGIKQGVAEAKAGVEEVNAGVADVKQGVADVKAGVADVKVGVDEVKVGVDEVKVGVNEVKEGVAEVKQEVIEGRAENNAHFEAARVQLENFRGEALEQFNLLRIDINQGAQKFKMMCLPIKTATRDEFINTLINCIVLFFYYIGLVIYHMVSYYIVMKNKFAKFLAKMTSIMLLFAGGAGLVIPIANIEMILHIFFFGCELAMVLFIGKLIGPFFGYSLEDEMGVELLFFVFYRVFDLFWLFVDFLHYCMKTIPPFNYFYKIFEKFGVFTAIQYIKDIFTGLINFLLYFSKPQNGRSWYDWGMGAKGGSRKTVRTMVPLRHRLLNYPRVGMSNKTARGSQFNGDIIDIHDVFAYELVTKAKSYFQRVQTDPLERENFLVHISKIGLTPEQLGTIVKARIEIAFTFFDGVINGRSIKDIMPSKRLLELARDPRVKHIPMKTILDKYNMTDKIKLVNSHSSVMKRKTRKFKIKYTLKQNKNRFNISKRFR
jgi:hypothetical protein